MTMPFSVPDWLPWWAMIAILVPVLIYLLAVLVMPFNTMGVKARLDLLEARLDEIHGEIRTLALRLPVLDSGEVLLPPTYREAARAIPPIPQSPAARSRRTPEPEAYETYDDEADADRGYREADDTVLPTRPPDMSRPAVARLDIADAEPPRPEIRPDMLRRPPTRRPEQRSPPGRAEPRIEWPR
jgi:hypothetical protein